MTLLNVRNIKIPNFGLKSDIVCPSLERIVVKTAPASQVLHIYFQTTEMYILVEII